VTNDRRYPRDDQRGRKIDNWRGVGSFGTIGLEIVLSIAFGFFGGRWLDEKFGTAPYLGGLGFVFGLAAAIKSVLRAHAEMQRLAEREEREQGNPRPVYETRDDDPKNAERTMPDDVDTKDDDDQGGKADR